MSWFLRALEPKGKIRDGPSKGTESISMPPPKPVPAVVPTVDSTSQSSQEFPATSAPASSPHHQEARKVKRVRCGKRKIRNCEASYERGEAEAHLCSPSVHQSGMSSDDLFEEDEVESVRPGHIEALTGAWSLKVEWLALQHSVPNVAVCPQQKSPLHSSTGGVLLAASPNRRAWRPSQGSDRWGSLRTSSVGLMVVSCTSAPLTRRSLKLVGLGGVSIILTSFNITGNGIPVQKGVKSHEVVSVVAHAAQANIFDEDVVSLGPGWQAVSGKPTELQQKLEDVKSKISGLGSLPRILGRRREQLQDDESLSRRQHRGLTGLLPRFQSKVDGSPQSVGRVTSSDLLPGIIELQSDRNFKCEDRLRRPDGAESDGFFESELFHEASPRAGSNLMERSRQLPGRLLAEALSSMMSFLGHRGEADVSDQPRVLTYLETVFNQRYGKDAVGLRTSREMRAIAEAVDARVERNVLRAGDLLIHRFKALETSVSHQIRRRSESFKNWVFTVWSGRSGVNQRRSNGSCKIQKLVSKTRERKEHRLKKCPSNLVIPGGEGLHQFRQSCLKREQLVVGSGSSDFTEATSKGPRRRSLCEFIRNARVAGCCDASVAPWRFGSGSAAHVLHTCRSLKQICATAGPIAAASSLELGAIRWILEAVCRRAKTSQQPSIATPSAWVARCWVLVLVDHLCFEFSVRWRQPSSWVANLSVKTAASAALCTSTDCPWLPLVGQTGWWRWRRSHHVAKFSTSSQT